MNFLSCKIKVLKFTKLLFLFLVVGFASSLSYANGSEKPVELTVDNEIWVLQPFDFLSTVWDEWHRYFFRRNGKTGTIQVSINYENKIIEQPKEFVQVTIADAKNAFFMIKGNQSVAQRVEYLNDSFILLIQKGGIIYHIDYNCDRSSSTEKPGLLDDNDAIVLRAAFDSKDSRKVENSFLYKFAKSFLADTIELSKGKKIILRRIDAEIDGKKYNIEGVKKVAD